jgi:predicted lysophospholipase L1 biosynthesis ABC-type transport system permease subunit
VQAGEVWLGRTAPDDVIDRLRGEGLAILGDRRLDTELRLSRDRPNAVGLRFLLAVGVLCLLLGAGGLAVTARIERRARADELRALRAQGLPRRMVARAGRVSYLALVLTAGVFGAGAAAAAWLATGERLPLVDVLVPGLAIPRWPSTLTLRAWAAAVAVLVVAAVFSGVVLTRAARTSNNRRSAT